MENLLVIPVGPWCFERFGLGVNYTGTVNVTETGKPCQRWDEQTPHSHSYTAAHFPDDTMEEAANYCRNTGDAFWPWCYTTTHVKWEFCAIQDIVCRKYCRQEDTKNAVIVVNYGISNTVMLEIPEFTTKAASYHSQQPITHTFQHTDTHALGKNPPLSARPFLHGLTETIPCEGFCMCQSNAFNRHNFFQSNWFLVISGLHGTVGLSCFAYFG